MTPLALDAETRRRLGNGAVAGLLGGAAFAATMLADMRISGRRVDDFELLAGFGPFRRYWKVVGPLSHFGASATLGALYGAFEHRAPGPGWRKGLAYALTENLLLWPLILVIDRVHPAIQEGSLPSFNRPWPFVAETLRHAAYGLVLGATFDAIQRRSL